MKLHARDIDSFGGRLTIKRTEAGLSQAALAGRSKVRQSHISQIERNKRVPNLETLRSLARGLKCRVGDLTDGPSGRGGKAA